MVSVSPAIELTRDDLSAIVAVHMVAFPQGAITFLGEEAVRRYYAWQFEGAHNLYPFGAYIDGQLAGFCFGGTFHGALGGYLRANRGFLIRRILFHPWLLLTSRVRDRFLFSLRYTFHLTSRRMSVQKETPTQPTNPTHFYSILSIATHPASQGLGVGRCLLERSERTAIEQGFSKMSLTVHVGNTQAIGFYEHLGWVKILEKNGEWAGRMHKSLSSSPTEMRE